MKQLKLTSLFGILLTLSLFLVLWLVDYAALGIPDKIPGTTYQTYSIAMFVVTAAILLVYQKLSLRTNPSANIRQLTGWSFLTAFASQLVYQSVRQVWILRFEQNNKFGDWVVSMLALLFLLLLISLSIALEVKKANLMLKLLSTGVLVGIILLLKEYLVTITW